MPKAKNKLVDEAFALYRQGLKLKDIAEKLDVPSGTIRRWKSTYKWDGERSEKITNVRNGKRGGQPNNKNAVGSGAPEKNTNAVKHGLFSKYLPKEYMQKYPKLKRCIIKIDYTSVLSGTVVKHYMTQLQLSELLKDTDIILLSVNAPTVKRYRRKKR